MKKSFIKFIFTFALFSCILFIHKENFAKNYENSFYSFYITDKFKGDYVNVTETSSYKSYYHYDYDNYYSTSIDFSAYSYFMGDAYDQSDVNDELKRIKNYYADPDIKEQEVLTYINGELVELNGVKGYRITYCKKYTDSDMEYGYDRYELRSDMYDYTISITSSRDFINSAEAKKIVKSFKIKDTVKKSNNGIPFIDVPSKEWYANAVKYTYNNKMISGYNDYTFAPNDKLSRAMIVTILYRMDGSPKNDGKTTFSDVPSNEWYSKAIKWAQANKIVRGYEGTTKFGPNDNILREDLAGILRNYAKYKKKDITATGDLSKFKDYKKVDTWALLSMKWAVGKGVITGNADGTLNPRGTATRAEAAAMIQKYCSKIGR